MRATPEDLNEVQLSACLNFSEENLRLFRKSIIEEVLAIVENNRLLEKRDELPDLLSVQQILKLTDPPICRSTLYNWVKERKVKQFKVGKRNYFSKNALLAFLTSVEKKPP